MKHYKFYLCLLLLTTGFLAFCFLFKNNNIDFPSLEQSVLNLKGNKNSETETVSDIENIIKNWDINGIREQAIKLMTVELKKNEAFPVILFERGSSFKDYRAFLVSNKFILYLETNGNKPWRSVLTNVSHNDLDKIYENIQTLKNYNGNASKVGSGISTFFCTIWEKEKVLNVFAIYDLTKTLDDRIFKRTFSEPYSREAIFYKDTIATAEILELLLKISGINIMKGSSES